MPRGLHDTRGHQYPEGGGGCIWIVQRPETVLPGLVLTAAGVGLALPTASIAITSGVQASQQGLAGALFTTSQQTGAAIGLAILATAAAAATAGHGGSLVDGYRLSFLIATGLAVLAATIVALQLSSKSHRVEPGHPWWRACLPCAAAGRRRGRRPPTAPSVASRTCSRRVSAAVTRPWLRLAHDLSARNLYH